MATLGEELKAAREGKQLTLRQIAERTRISLSFLAALEADDYSSIPGEVFVTGFLRSYARELGIPENDILAKYRQLPPPFAEPSFSQVKTQHKARPSLKNIPHSLVVKKMPLPALIIAGLVLGCILTVLAVMFATQNKPEPAATTESPVMAATPKPLATPTTANTFGLGSSLKPAAAPSQAVNPQPAAAQTGSSQVVKLTATGKSWYSYSADKGQRKHGVLDKGASLSIEADGIINLDLGNSGGVRVEYNGKEMKPYGRVGVPVKNIVFSKDVPGEVLSYKNGAGPRKIEKAR